MRRLRNIAGVMMVWATAATTLLAATPHYDCRCPDGSIKTFCFGSGAGESSCCCSGTCSKAKNGKSCCRTGSSGSRSTAKPACCCKQSKPAGASVASEKKPLNEPVVRGSCCQKILVQPEIQSSDRASPIVDETPVVATAVLLAAKIEYLSDVALSRTWQVQWLPPPTDLVTTLHRLNI